MAPGDCSAPTTASISRTWVSACWTYWGSCGRDSHLSTASLKSFHSKTWSRHIKQPFQRCVFFNHVKSLDLDLMSRDHVLLVETYTGCLYQGSANFCKGPGAEHFRVCGPCSLCHDNSALPSRAKAAADTVKERAGCGSVRLSLDVCQPTGFEEPVCGK